jgi:hypothetical protein
VFDLANRGLGTGAAPAAAPVVEQGPLRLPPPPRNANPPQSRRTPTVLFKAIAVVLAFFVGSKAPAPLLPLYLHKSSVSAEEDVPTQGNHQAAPVL